MTEPTKPADESADDAANEAADDAADETADETADEVSTEPEPELEPEPEPEAATEEHPVVGRRGRRARTDDAVAADRQVRRGAVDELPYVSGRISKPWVFPIVAVFAA